MRRSCWVVNKDASIYVHAIKYPMMLDPGSCAICMSRCAAQDVGAKLSALPNPIRYRDVDDRGMVFNQCAGLQFTCKGTWYLEVFLLLPSASRYKLILSRQCIKDNSYECTIPTPEEKIMVNYTYPIPRMLQDGTVKAIQKLLDKGHILGLGPRGPTILGLFPSRGSEDNH